MSLMNQSDCWDEICCPVLTGGWYFFFLEQVYTLVGDPGVVLSGLVVACCTHYLPRDHRTENQALEGCDSHCSFCLPLVSLRQDCRWAAGWRMLMETCTSLPRTTFLCSSCSAALSQASLKLFTTTVNSPLHHWAATLESSHLHLLLSTTEACQISALLCSLASVCVTKTPFSTFSVFYIGSWACP